MKRLRKHAQIGVRWLRCGWRLFQRNPWLLSGMALASMAIIILLTLVPLLGALLIALAAPILMASAILTVHDLSKQKIPLPASLKFAAFARGPKELFRVIGDEKHIVTVFLVGIYALTVTLLINILAYLTSGVAWVSDLSSLDVETLLKTLATRLVVLMLYLSLAVSLIYAIPLIFLQDEPVVPAIGRSLRAGARHAVALLVIVGFLLAPFALGAIASLVSRLTAYVIWLVGGTFVLPVFIASCYCSYRTVFPAR